MSLYLFNRLIAKSYIDFFISIFNLVSPYVPYRFILILHEQINQNGYFSMIPNETLQIDVLLSPSGGYASSHTNWNATNDIMTW